MREVIGKYKFSARQLAEMTNRGIAPMGYGEIARPLASYKFTLDQYMAMADAGIFDSDDRVELIDGVILQMAPIGKPHGSRVSIVVQTLMGKVPRNPWYTSSPPYASMTAPGRSRISPS